MKVTNDSVLSREFKIDSAVPISLPSLIIPAPGPPAAKGDDKADFVLAHPAKVGPVTRAATVPAGPSRAEIEALIRAIGHDAITTTLVDRVAARFDSRQWSGDFDRIRQLATDQEFVQHMDGLAREVLGKALDTIMLLRCVASYEVGYDDATMRSMLRGWLADDRTPPITIRGTIIDQGTNRPIRNARLSTDLHDFADEPFVRTDDQGRFSLRYAPIGRIPGLHGASTGPEASSALGRGGWLRACPVVCTARGYNEGGGSRDRVEAGTASLRRCGRFLRPAGRGGRY